MVSNIVNKLSHTFSSSINSINFHKKNSDNALIEVAGKNDRLFKQMSTLNNHKHSGTVLRKLWNRTSSETSTRISSSDEQPLLGSFEDEINKKNIEFSIAKNTKRKFCDKEQAIDVEKSKSIEALNTTLILEKQQRDNLQDYYISSFNYKSYPLSNRQILNWMNKNWSEEELDGSIYDLVNMEIDAKKYQYTNQKNKKNITPFHSLTSPKISIGEYFTTRIVKFICLTSVDFCVVIILVRRAIEKSNGTLKITTLTAHRLVLAAALLTYKLMYDVQYGIRFWAHIGGVPQWEMIMLEYHLLKLLNWDLNITPQEFKSTYLEVLSSKDSHEKSINKNQDLTSMNKEIQTKTKSHLKVSTSKSKCTTLHINVSNQNSNRRK